MIAENLSEEEIMGLKEMFKSMDTDNSGMITYEEWKAGLPKLGTRLSESEIRQLMEAVISLGSFFLLVLLILTVLLKFFTTVPSMPYLLYGSTDFFCYVVRLMLMEREPLITLSS